MASYQEYRKALIELVNSIDAEIGLEEENAVLILHKLNSVEKISQFAEWGRSRMQNGKLQATEEEICRAAVQISKELRPVTKNRDKLLKALLDQGVSTTELGEIVKPMQGKNQEEKEQIAAQILAERGIE